MLTFVSQEDSRPCLSVFGSIGVRMRMRDIRYLNDGVATRPTTAELSRWVQPQRAGAGGNFLHKRDRHAPRRIISEAVCCGVLRPQLVSHRSGQQKRPDHLQVKSSKSSREFWFSHFIYALILTLWNVDPSNSAGLLFWMYFYSSVLSASPSVTFDLLSLSMLMLWLFCTKSQKSTALYLVKWKLLLFKCQII